MLKRLIETLEGPRRCYIDEIPLDLFLGILDQLHHEDYKAFLSVRSTCRTSRRHSEKIMFKTIRLNGRADKEICLWRRLQDADDSLAQNVQHLILWPIHDWAVTRICDLLVSAWARFSDIQTLSWNSYAELPTSILNHARSRPNISIKVKTFDASWFRMDDEPDEESLGLPQLVAAYLTSLDTRSKYEHCPPGPDSLKYALQKATNLKTLTIRENHRKNLTADLSEANSLPSQASSPKDSPEFPYLEELDLHYENKSASEIPRQPLISFMDWSKLHTLNIGGETHYSLLSIFIGRVPQLKGLRFRSGDERPPKWVWRGKDTPDLLVQSINALESIGICTSRFAGLRRMRRMLFEKHGRSLRHLETFLDPRCGQGWPAEEFTKMVTMVPRLRAVTASLELARENPLDRRSRIIWPREVTNALTQLSDLEVLTLRVRLLMSARQFIRKVPTGGLTLNEVAVGEEARRLFEGFRNCGSGSAIKKVVVMFHLGDLSAVWTFTVTHEWNMVSQRYDTLVERTAEGVDTVFYSHGWNRSPSGGIVVNHPRA